VLVGLSAFMVVPMWLLLTRSACACQSRVKSAYNEAVQLQGAIERFMLESDDRCPKDLEDLKAANIVRSADLRDPWGRRYVFMCREEHTPVVCSFGPAVEATDSVCSDQYPFAR